MIRLLVVDDSALMRKLLGGIFGAEGDFEVRLARNGIEALEAVHAFAPHVVTLDIHMPEMDGLACLDRIMLEKPCPVVMLSSLTEEGADATLEAMRLGAVDVIAKPGGAVSLEIDRLAPRLVEKVRAAAGARLRSSLRLRERVRLRAAPSELVRPLTPARAVARPVQAPAPEITPRDPGGFGLILIGTSTGGPPALETVLTELPADLAWPVLVAQHMPASFTGALARRLNRICALEVLEVTRPTRLAPGHVYIGRGDADLVVASRPGGLVALPAPSHPDFLWHPSVDRLVASALEHAGAPNLVGVLMTGMGHDGAKTMAQLRQDGGRTIAESEESAVVWGMPGELVKAGGADAVLPVDEIAGHILALVGRSHDAAFGRSS